jgi:hypothetical protein
MKKVTKSILFFCPLILCLFLLTSLAYGQQSERYFYQLKIYHLKDKAQEKRVDQFLQTAYVPALHRAGIEQVGVFTPVEEGEAGPLIYVFIPFRSLDEFQNLSQVLAQDQQFLASGSDYLYAPYDKVPYDRIESILLHAFTGMPAPAVPELPASKSERVYELRSYEGPTEKYYATKVRMFIEGDELSIFDRLGFNAVFYAEVLSGPRMPNLMYMTSFNNMAERDAHWEAFNNDAAWKKLKAIEEYQHSVSKADIILLHPTAYSDF